MISESCEEILITMAAVIIEIRQPEAAAQMAFDAYIIHSNFA